MKTTVEISDSLFAEVRRVAHEEQQSLRALIEEGLRLVVRQRKGQRRRFRLRDASFAGTGLHPDLGSGGWEAVREEAYAGRGG